MALQKSPIRVTNCDSPAAALALLNGLGEGRAASHFINASCTSTAQAECAYICGRFSLIRGRDLLASRIPPRAPWALDNSCATQIIFARTRSTRCRCDCWPRILMPPLVHAAPICILSVCLLAAHCVFFLSLVTRGGDPCARLGRGLSISRLSVALHSCLKPTLNLFLSSCTWLRASFVGWKMLSAVDQGSVSFICHLILMGKQTDRWWGWEDHGDGPKCW